MLLSKKFLTNALQKSIFFLFLLPLPLRFIGVVATNSSQVKGFSR